MWTTIIDRQPANHITSRCPITPVKCGLTTVCPLDNSARVSPLPCILVPTCPSPTSRGIAPCCRRRRSAGCPRRPRGAGGGTTWCTRSRPHSSPPPHPEGSKGQGKQRGKQRTRHNRQLVYQYIDMRPSRGCVPRRLVPPHTSSTHLLYTTLPLRLFLSAYLDPSQLGIVQLMLCP